MKKVAKAFPEIPNPEPLLAPEDLERVLKVNRRTIDRLCKKGVLPKPIKLGGSRRWRVEDVRMAISQLANGLGANDR